MAKMKSKMFPPEGPPGEMKNGKIFPGKKS